MKVIVQPLKVSTGFLGIPGGGLWGGLYMMWLVLAVCCTKLKYAGTLVSVLQAIITFATGLSASFGAMVVPIYLSAGIVSDITLFLFRSKYHPLSCAIACMLANLAGSMTTSYAIFSIPIIPLLILAVVSMISGAIGGVFAYIIYKRVKKLIKE